MKPPVLDPETRLLFVAMSRNQGRYFQELIDQLGINGRVLLAKHPGYGSPLRALRWARAQGIDSADWLRFKLDKARVNDESQHVVARLALQLRTLHFLDAFRRAAEDFQPDGVVLWNGAHYKQRALIDYCGASEIKLLYLELGFLPNTMAIDSHGVNYNNSLPRHADFYRDYQPRGESLLTELVKRPPRTEVGDEIELPEHYIFVPFQVYDDTQVLVHSPWVRSMEDFHQLLEDSVAALPEGWSFVVKEHPTSTRSYRQLHDRHPRVIFANANNTQQLIEGAELVVTINSTAGIEALMLGRPVLTVGKACYNVKGLVQHARSAEEFRAMISSGSYPYDADLVGRFIAYLNEQYLIPGRPRDRERFLDESHYRRMAERIAEILSEQAP